MLLLLVSILLISNVATADNIGIYSDGSGASCELNTGFSPAVSIIEKFAAGTTASHFKISLPAGSSYFGFTTNWVPVGPADSDMWLYYGSCQTGSIVLGTITAILTTGYARILPADTYTQVTYTNCASVNVNATGLASPVGIPGDCTTPVEPSTWGGVKALYR
jgi:hypothetical protein